MKVISSVFLIGFLGVKVIGLAVQSGWARDIKRFATKYKMGYPILVGTDVTEWTFSIENSIKRAHNNKSWPRSRRATASGLSSSNIVFRDKPVRDNIYS